VDPRTQQQLATADRFRDLARALASGTGAGLVTPPPLDWALVVAFYAAVQYVGAYLWERQRVQFRNHQTRERALSTVPALRGAQQSYLRLRRLSENTRYTYRFRPRPAEVRDALDNDLDVVRRVVLTALGQQP
jgi:hypothetical protein